MTYREKLMKEHPENVNTDYIGDCPGWYWKGAPIKGFCGPFSTVSCKQCAECWNTEIPGTEGPSEPDIEVDIEVDINNLNDFCDELVKARATLMLGGFTSKEAYEIICKLIPYMCYETDMTTGDIIKALMNKEEQK